jgi:acyl-coenzyme A synthetase/AMP-(fatty) acid ligase
MPVHIPCPVYEKARHRPQDAAILWDAGGRSITWEVLSHYVSSTVRHLKEYGIRSGCRVAFVTGFDPSFVIVALSLWRMGASICVLDQDLGDDELSLVARQFHPALVIVNRKRKIKAHQMLLEEAVALEEVKNFWCGSEEAVPEIDTQMEAAIFIDKGLVTSVSYGNLLAGHCAGVGPFLQTIVNGLRSGKTIVIEQ